jgi:outer membrane protein OmpA-like peptidoglycan-associated protein
MHITPVIHIILLLTVSSFSILSQDTAGVRASDTEQRLVDQLYEYNLVPNADFHSFQRCPEKYTIIPKSYFVDNWTMPTGGTPDYFNVCSYEAGVPANWVGHLNPRKGYGYVGLIGGRYTTNYGKVSEVREYIQSELKTPMMANQVYYVRFFVSLAGYSRYALDGMGISFSDTLVDLNNYIERLPLVEHIGNPSGNYLDKKGQWMKIEGYYTAKGTERYIILGNFKSDNDTKEKDMFTRSDLNCSYYLVDDILVAPVSEKFLATNESQNVDSLSRAKDIYSMPEFHPILFDFNQSEVNKEFKNTIVDLAEYMNLYPEVKVSLIGHTDSVGDDTYNMSLSTKRAKEVANLLAARDISKDRLKIKGKGETEPLNGNENEHQRALNRRVEIEIQ